MLLHTPAPSSGPRSITFYTPNSSLLIFYLSLMEYKTQRNEDFLRRFTHIMAERARAGLPLAVTAAVREAIASGAPRFYLTREYALKQLRLRRQGRRPPGERPYIATMWAELDEALAQRMRSRASEDEWVALDAVLVCHSPSRFFISEAEALRLVRDANPPLLAPERPSPRRHLEPRSPRLHRLRRSRLRRTSSFNTDLNTDPYAYRT